MRRLVRQLTLLKPPARRLSVAIISCLLVVDLVWLPFSALQLSNSNLAVVAVLVGCFLLAGPAQRRFGFSAVARHLAVELYILILFGAVGFIFSYLVIENGAAIRDDLFVAIDNSLGFDWPTYARFFLNNDLLRSVSLVLYVLTPALVGFAFFWNGLNRNLERVSELVAMVIVGGIWCVIISGIAPSVGGAGYFPTDDEFYMGYRVVFDNTYKLTFFQLRDAAGVEILLLRPFALIAFPSYHACLVTLVILVLWGTGVKGWAIFVLNVGALLSLPIQGGHHLSDVLGGVVVGALTYWLIRHTSRRFA